MSHQVAFPTSDVALTSEPSGSRSGLALLPAPEPVPLPVGGTVLPDLPLPPRPAGRPSGGSGPHRRHRPGDGCCNTSAGDAAVIVTTHLLVNQHDQPVFVLTKDSYYAAIPGLEGRGEAARTGAAHAAFDNALDLGALEVANASDLANSGAFFPSSLPIEEGEVILPCGAAHRPSPPSATPTPSTSTPSATDAKASSSAADSCSCRIGIPAGGRGTAHPAGTVMPEDRIGALSRVLSVTDAGNGMEEVVISTLGLQCGRRAGAHRRGHSRGPLRPSPRQAGRPPRPVRGRMSGPGEPHRDARHPGPAPGEGLA